MGWWKRAWILVVVLLLVSSICEGAKGEVQGDTNEAGESNSGSNSVLTHGQEILSKFESVFIGIMIPVGLVGSMFGIILFRPFLVIAGSVAGGGAAYLFMEGVTKESAAAAWGPIVVGILAALFFGFLAYKLSIVGVFAIGSSLGVALALMLCTTRFYDTASPTNPKRVLIITATLLGIITGIASLFLQRILIVIAMAYSGSFATVYGLGYFVGHFPNLKQMHDDSFFKSPWLWLWIVLFLAQASVGMFLQFRILHGTSEAGKPEEDGANSFFFRGGNEGEDDVESQPSTGLDWANSWNDNDEEDISDVDESMDVSPAPPGGTPPANVRRLAAGRNPKKD